MSGSVVVVGAAGRLGDSIVHAFADRTVVAHTRASLDVTSPEAVQRVVGLASPDVIVNCAAFNDVDGAEDRPTEAFAVNAFAVRSLARAAEECGATLVHFGSDFVFDGTGDRPYGEEDPPAPRSAYGLSKLLGDWFALDAPRGFVLRVESLFGGRQGWTGRRGSFDGIVQGLEAGRDVRVFTDRVVSPSFVEDVAQATRFLIDRAAPPGLYHCVNSGRATWYEVAVEAARLLGATTPRLQPVTLSEMRLKAARPRFCALANAKLAAAGFEMPAWEHALERWLSGRASRMKGVHG